MADEIEIIPADAAQQTKSTPAQARQAADNNGANGNGNANGNSNGNGHANGNGNGAATGHITINRRSAPNLDTPAMESAPSTPGGSTPAGPNASPPPAPAPSAQRPAPNRGFAPPQTASHCVHLHIAEDSANSDTIMKLWSICKAHPGQTEVWLHIDNGLETLQLKVSPAYFVVPTPEFCDQVLGILGEGRVLVPQ